MDEQRKKWRGPITRFVDWFMVDPFITGSVIAPLVLFALIVGYLVLRDLIAARF